MTADDLRLVLLDIDGCLIAGEASPWDLEVITRIAEMNRRASRGRGFAVTICSGRQPPYVEAVMQAIGGRFPAVFEYGAGLYFPDQYRFLYHPAITPPSRYALERIRAVLKEKLADTGLAQLQPGKEQTMTLHPVNLDSMTGKQLAARVRAALRGEPEARHVSVMATSNSVEVLPEGLNKSWGVKWLAQHTGVSLGAMGGIGDTDADLDFLRTVGRSAAPANATDKVKTGVDYVSRRARSRGVLDILNRWERQEGLQEKPHRRRAAARRRS